MDLFFTFVIAVVLEAAPFLLLGSVLSAILEHVVPDGFLARKLPRGPIASTLCGMLAGMILPTCECGVVPVTRRLISKGVPPNGAIAYMLAAPVINPVVIASTYMAFRGDLFMVGARLAVVGLTASVLGATLRGMEPKDILLRPDPPSPQLKELTLPGHAHPHDCGCGCDHGGQNLSLPMRIARTAALEFMDMGRFLILGAMAAAAFKILLPENLVMAVESNLTLSILAMMLLALALSICSEADAFVAASFSSFDPAAQLAFVTIGPMVDLKLIGMFLTTFRRPLVAALVITPCIVVFVCCLTFGFAALGWRG